MEASNIIGELDLLSIDDVKRIRAACDGRIKIATADMKYVLRPGDRVLVKGGRNTNGETGTIEKVNRTKCVVLIDEGRAEGKWNVPFALINLIDE